MDIIPLWLLRNYSVVVMQRRLPTVVGLGHIPTVSTAGPRHSAPGNRTITMLCLKEIVVTYFPYRSTYTFELEVARKQSILAKLCTSLSLVFFFFQSVYGLKCLVHNGVLYYMLSFFFFFFVSKKKPLARTPPPLSCRKYGAK